MGHDVTIYAPLAKSPIRGAILLHTPIPGITRTHPEAYIPQIVIGGNIDDYGRKIYGGTRVERGEKHGDPFKRGFHTWSVPETYDLLWEHFYNRIIDMTVDAFVLNRLIEAFDLVVNTAPAPQFCSDPTHEFISAEIDLTWETMVPNQRDNTIYYNADANVPWARSSSIFGSVVTEWVKGRAPEDAHRIWKPIRTTCDCFPEVFRTGRYGAWDNLSWIETAYYGTRERILGV